MFGQRVSILSIFLLKSIFKCLFLGLGGSKEVYLDACEKLKSYTSILYLLQKKLILTLMNNQDGDETSPSSRKIFMSRFRGFTMDNLSVSFILAPNLELVKLVTIVLISHWLTH